MTGPAKIRPIDLALGTSLYALQGVVVAYLVAWNKPYMIAAGVQPVVAGRVETLVLLTLVLKFVLGPFSDRFSPFGQGHRRPFIAMGLVAQSIGLAGLAAVNPGTNLAGYGSLALLAVGGLALYDTCCDGLIVDVTPSADRARVQGMLQVARFLATMVATLGFGAWINATGIGPGRSGGLLLACASLGAVPLAITLAARGGPGSRSEGRFDWAGLQILIRPRSLAVFAFGAIAGVVGLGVEFNLSGYYAGIGFTPGGIGVLTAIRYGGRAIGALLLPTLGGRLGRRGQVVLGVVALSLAIMLEAPGSENGAIQGARALAFGMAIGWIDALFCVLAMEASDPKMAASTFAVFMAVSNVGAVGDALFLEVARATGPGYGPAFVSTAIVALGLLVFTPLLAPPRPGATADHDD